MLSHLVAVDDDGKPNDDDLQRTGKDRSIIRILEEIEVHCVFVILSGKFQYRKGLAALTAALDDKRLPAGRVFPCKQLVCDLSP